MMIDENGNLRCDGCRKKLGGNLQGRVEIVCPRCKRFNVFEMAEALAELDGKVKLRCLTKS